MKKSFAFLFIALSMLFCCTLTAESTASYANMSTFYDTDSVMYVACGNGLLYTLHDSGLYTLSSTESEEVLVASSDELPKHVYDLLSDGQEIYCLTQDEGFELRLLVDKEGSYVNQACYSNRIQSSIQSPRVKNGTLCYLTVDNSEPEIVICSMDEKEPRTLPANGVFCFDIMPNGDLLALVQEAHWPEVTTTLQIIHQDSGEATLWAEISPSQSLSRLIFDGTANTAYLFGRSEIFSVAEGGKLKLTDRFLGGDVISTCLLADGAAIVVDDFLVIRNFETSHQPEKPVLTVLDPYGRGEEYRSFFADNPQVDVRFVHSGTQSSEEQFIQDMTVRDESTDIYVLSDTSLLQTIKAKGYFADMSASQQIADLTVQMYAPFRDALMNAEAIAAFPKALFIDVLCYHKPTFERLGIEPPATYEEYFDFCIQWYDAYADDFQDVVLNPFANRMSIASILEQYTDTVMRSGLPIAYCTDAMEGLIQKYQTVQAYAEASESAYQGGTPLFYGYALPCLDRESEYAYLPLTFEKDAQPLFSPWGDSLSYFIVNPNSKHPREAMALVASFDGQRTEIEKALLYESICTPIENAFYQQEHRALQETLDALNAELVRAKPEQAKELSEKVKRQEEKILAHEKKDRWAVSLDALQIFKSYAENIYINAFNPIQILASKSPELFDGLDGLDGFDASLFLAGIDKKVQMLLLENGIPLSHIATPSKK
ncbi:MAG: hypothetical protein RR085_10630 [Clostridia bacterium]